MRDFRRKNHRAAASYQSANFSTSTASPLSRQRRNLTPDSKRLVIVLVGLPGRGKSFVARKLSSFLTWGGTEAKIFNVGRYRRQAVAESSSVLQTPSQNAGERAKNGACSASFFDNSNKEAAAMRQAVAEAALKDMLEWLDRDLDGESGSTPASLSTSSTSTEVFTKDRIAIFDATNSTKERRAWVLEECTCPSKRKDKQTGVVFVESICDDEELLEENFRFKILNSPDFKGMSTDEAVADLKKRVEKYEDMYETIADDSLSYIKIFNLSSKLLVNQMYGRMAKTIVPALIAWNIGTRPVFLCRAGSCPFGKDEEHYAKPKHVNTIQSPQSKRKSIAGKKLGPKGNRFRDDLKEFVRSEGLEFINQRVSAVAPVTTGTSISGVAGKIVGEVGTTGEELPFPCVVMSSTMPRAVQTVTWDNLPFPVEQLSSLNPLDKGDFGGMELDDIRKENPGWYAQLEQDPFHTR